MKRKPYYPTQQAAQGNWHGNFADKVEQYTAALQLNEDQVEGRVLDALFMRYVLSQWLVDLRTFAESGAQVLEQLSYGTDPGAVVLPVFTPPPLPPGDAGATPPVPATVPVPEGALTRIFDFVQVIKRSPGYTEAIGQDLGILGDEDTGSQTSPTFTARTEQGEDCQCVRMRIKRYGHYATAVYSRRGGGGWELLGIAGKAVFMDERPLLVAGQPEVREYRMRFWDAGAENGEWSDVKSITVSL